MPSALRRYRALEARQAFGWAPLAGLLVGLLLIGLCSLLLPRLPASAIALMERMMLIRGMGAVVLVNDYLAIYFVAFFVGAAGLMRALVEPREERSLEVLLSKPLSRRVFLSARVGPVLLAAAAVGLGMTLATGLAAVPYAAEEGVSVLGALGAGVVLSALVVLLLALLVLPLLLVRDTFQGFLAAFGFWMGPMVPLVTLIYRPDVFGGHEWLRVLLAMPANLIWFDAAMPVTALVLLAVALGTSWLALGLGARLFERIELR